MSAEDKARRLAVPLQTVMEEAQAADKKRAAAREDLSWQEIRVLRAVERRDCCVMSGLADAICLSLSSVTGLIDRLVAKKLVRRDRSTEDRRVVQVELTEQGRAAHEKTMEGPIETAREMLKGLNSEEQETLLALMRKISDRLESEKKAG